MAELRVVLAVVAMLFSLVGAARGGEGGCEGEWSNRSTAVSLNQDFELIEQDFGRGPELFAFGAFTNAEGTHATGFARLVGDRWVGAGGAHGDPGPVHLHRVIRGPTAGPTSLLGVGTFKQANGTTVTGVGAYDGERWAMLGGPIIAGGIYIGREFDLVLAPVAGRETLVVHGSFSTIGSVICQNIAYWDGMQWLPMSHANETGLALQEGQRLHVADFGDGPVLTLRSNVEVYPNGQAAGGVVRFDGSKWRPVATAGGERAPFGTASATVVRDGRPTLYVWGTKRFGDWTLGPTGLWIWNGEGWSFEGSGGLTSVARLLSFRVGGEERLAADVGGTGASRIQLWDGSEWTPVLQSALPSGYQLLGVDQPGFGERILARTSLRMASVTIRSVLEPDGDRWIDLCGATLRIGPSGVHSLVSMIGDDGLRTFGIANSSSGRGTVQELRDGTWQPLDAPWYLRINDVIVHDDGSGPALYVADRSEVYRWDGVAWTRVGDMSSLSIINGLCELRDDGRTLLVAYGRPSPIAIPNQPPPASVVAWDGTAWSRLGPALTERNGGSHGLYEVTKATVHDAGSGPELYIVVGWRDPSQSYLAVSRVLTLRNHDWAVLPPVTSFGPQTYTINDIASFDGPQGMELVVAGGWRETEAGPYTGAAVFRDGAWSPILQWNGNASAPLLVGSVLTPLRLNGKSLLAMGSASSGRTLLGLWDGESWTHFSAASVSRITGLEVTRRNGRTLLRIGGQFLKPTNSNDANYSEFTFCESPCPADFNADGRTDGRDLTMMLSHIGKRNFDPMFLPDVNTDGWVDGRDLAVLLATFGAACD